MLEGSPAFNNVTLNERFESCVGDLRRSQGDQGGDKEEVLKKVSALAVDVLSSRDISSDEKKKFISAVENLLDHQEAEGLDGDDSTVTVKCSGGDIPVKKETLTKIGSLFKTVVEMDSIAKEVDLTQLAADKFNTHLEIAGLWSVLKLAKNEKALAEYVKDPNNIGKVIDFLTHADQLGFDKEGFQNILKFAAQAMQSRLPLDWNNEADVKLLETLVKLNENYKNPDIDALIKDTFTWSKATTRTILSDETICRRVTTLLVRSHLNPIPLAIDTTIGVKGLPEFLENLGDRPISLHLMAGREINVYLKDLCDLKNLVSLDISKSEYLVDRGIAHLSTLTGLTSLNLEFTKITDAGLAHLSTLTGLTSLNLNGCDKITDEGLVHLSNLTGLTSLNLSGCDKIADKGIAYLSNLTGLTSLNLEFTGITDAGLAHLTNLTGLTTVAIVGTDITDAGLAQLDPRVKVID